MERLKEYLFDVLGVTVTVDPMDKKELNSIPFFLNQVYEVYSANLFNRPIVLVRYKDEEDFGVSQSEKHLRKLRNLLNKLVVLVLDEVAAYNRKRLIERRVNFIVPGKQLFLPEMLMDLREVFLDSKSSQKRNTLYPSAQHLILYHILNRNNNWRIEEYPFKKLAMRFGYTPMAISKAVDNLKQLELVDVVGEKEKYLRFRFNQVELWNIIEQRKIWCNPVLKKVFVDEKPVGVPIVYSNTSALPEYSNMNPSRQIYLAIEKNRFYGLQKGNLLVNANAMEGKYCLEVWKYNPFILSEIVLADAQVVDPLSLYISLINNTDERIEMALEQIKQKYIW